MTSMSVAMFHVLSNGEQLCVGVTICAVIVVIILGLVNAYQEVDPLSHRVEEAAANIEVAMQKRTQLIKGLIRIASQYAEHEKLVHLTVSADRRGGASYYQHSGKAVNFIAQLADSFPALRADTTYLQLMNDFKQVEGELQGRYETYNAAVRDFNAKRSSFPIVLFVNFFPQFTKAQYLDPSLWFPR